MSKRLVQIIVSDVAPLVVMLVQRNIGARDVVAQVTDLPVCLFCRSVVDREGVVVRRAADDFATGFGLALLGGQSPAGNPAMA